MKWIGNKQRFAHQIISCFPKKFGIYYEPFLGSGAVLGTLTPDRAVASDSFGPLMEIWNALSEDPPKLMGWYEKRYNKVIAGEKKLEYEKIKTSFNRKQNGADLLFLCRSCYGGVVRFRKDGYMSTPVGIHNPMKPENFSKRVSEWHQRTKKARFLTDEYVNIMRLAQKGDLVYCDPPYSFTQAILYGAQSFSLNDLLQEIDLCKSRGVYVALSIDGKKRSGDMICEIEIPSGLFEREIFIDCGRSMLKRFQMKGKSLENEVVHDRLFLTY